MPTANAKDVAGATRTLPSHLRYARLTADLPPEPKRTPSMLAAELKGAAVPAAALQRPRVVSLLNMSEFTHNVESVVPLDEPLFQPSPPEVVFDSFEPFGKYTTTLRFRNNDSVNRRLKVLKIDSVHFEVLPPKGAAQGGSKVAPGMEVTYKIVFTPRAAHDHACELVCLSEREKFVVMISARGPRPCFEFPDGVEFGLQPVRANATEAFLLRNTGNADGRFVLSVPRPFEVTPSDALLRAGESLQLTFGFKPEVRGDYGEELLIEYDTGERCYARLSGASSDVEVGLERSLLVLEPCYISLLSQTTIKLHNRSDVKVQFAWKQLRAAGDDEAQRMDALMRLDEQFGLPPHELRAQRRLIEEDPLAFADGIFSIEPLEGEVFPNSYCELTVAFRPQSAGEAAVTAFCELTGREARLPLTLQGRGLGPKATWLYESLDIGDVYVNSEHKYEVVLENHGDIDCEYSLAPNPSLFASRFSFAPNAGHLRSRQQQVVEVRLCSDLLGELNETFVWRLHGQPDPLPLQIKGRVVGPTFNFDLPDGVHYGHVSLGFLYTRTLNLSNTSEIPMRFRLRVPNEVGEPHDEFEVLPSQGILLPHGSVQVKLSFISTKVAKYNLSMLVDVEAVGDSLLTLPITAECIVPAIEASADALEYNDTFIGYTYEQSVTIINPSHLPAKYEMIDESPMLKAIGEYELVPPRGQIEAKSSIECQVKFTAGRLGPMILPLYVRIVGLEEASFCIELNAKGIGPYVNLSQPRVDWGKSQVLTDIVRPLTLTNDSLVPAVCKAFLRRSGTPFSLPYESFTMAPQEVLDFQLTVRMDDAVKATNDLLFQIVNAPEQVVPLTAVGIGATITSSRENMAAVDFGENFSSTIIKKEFTLENLGRQSQQLAWLNVASIPPPKDKNAKEKPEPPPLPVFNITPDKVLMEPGATCTFVVRGLAPSGGFRTEQLQCTAVAGGGSGKGLQLYEMDVCATFIEPLVEPTPTALEFEYVYKPGDEKAPVLAQTKSLKLKNISPLALTMYLRALPPFSVATSELHLRPGDHASVLVSFDANYPGDLVSRKYADASNRLQLSFKEHPQKSFVTLEADNHYPNLSMSLTEGAFGCIFNDAPSKLTLTLTNTSTVGAAYSWSFADAANLPDPLPFDILPIRGYLEAVRTAQLALL